MAQDTHGEPECAAPTSTIWVTVPREPTDAQVIAALKFALEWMAQHGVDHLSPFETYPSVTETTRGMYRAMVSAAPHQLPAATEIPAPLIFTRDVR